MQKVKKAVIPVAGYGTRFLPFTKAIPKAMLPVVNVPAIQIIIEEAVKSGIEEILLIVGQHKATIEAHFSSADELEEVLTKRQSNEFLQKVIAPQNLAKISYVVQEVQNGTGNAVLLAEQFVNGEPFAVLFGDDVMFSEKPVLAQLIDVFERENKTVIGVQSVGYENLAKYAACDFDLHEGNIYNVTALVEKPDPSLAKSDIAPLGRYVLRADFFENLHNLKPGIHGEYQLTDALAMEINREGLLAYEFEGRRFDTGDVFGFLQANIEFSLQNPEYKDKMQEYLKNLVKKF